MATTYTENTGLALLDRGSSNWDTVNNGNFAIIDQQLGFVVYDDEAVFYDDEQVINA